MFAAPRSCGFGRGIRIVRRQKTKEEVRDESWRKRPRNIFRTRRIRCRVLGPRETGMSGAEPGRAASGLTQFLHGGNAPL